MCVCECGRVILIGRYILARLNCCGFKNCEVGVGGEGGRKRRLKVRLNRTHKVRTDARTYVYAYVQVDGQLLLLQAVYVVHVVVQNDQGK